jgi:hypothetical protein
MLHGSISMSEPLHAFPPCSAGDSTSRWRVLCGFSSLHADQWVHSEITQSFFFEHSGFSQGSACASFPLQTLPPSAGAV